MTASTSRALACLGFLATHAAMQPAASQNEYVNFLFETEGPFLEQLYYVEGDPVNDLAKCGEYIGDAPNNVRIWASERLGESAGKAIQAAGHFIRSSVRDSVLQRAIDSTSADELAMAGIRNMEDLRELICRKLFGETPEGYGTAIIAVGAVPDPANSHHWMLGDAPLGIHDEKQIFFLRLNGEHLARADHGRDWVTGGNHENYFWGGIIGDAALHALGFGQIEDRHPELAHAYGRSLSGIDLSASRSARVFPREPSESFGHAGGCAYGPEPRGPYTFIRGDVDGSGALDITDAVRLLRMLFGANELEALPSCAHALDANDDDELDISDPIRILTGLFLDGSMLPPHPYPAPGEDPTPGKYWGDCIYDFPGAAR